VVLPRYAAGDNFVEFYLYLALVLFVIECMAGVAEHKVRSLPPPPANPPADPDAC